VVEAETRREKLRVTAQLVLLEHTRLGANRDAKARAAILAESGLPA